MNLWSAISHFSFRWIFTVSVATAVTIAQQTELNAIVFLVKIIDSIWVSKIPCVRITSRRNCIDQMAHDSVPVVYGGSDYSSYLPAGSYVNAMDFESGRASQETDVGWWTLFETLPLEEEICRRSSARRRDVPSVSIAERQGDGKQNLSRHCRMVARWAPHLFNTTSISCLNLTFNKTKILSRN